MHAPSRRTLGEVVVVIVPVILYATGMAPAWINHDAAWYLHAAAAWLDGAVLYRDVIDTNPPLIVFVSAVPVLLGRMLHLPATALLKAMILVFAGGVGLLAMPVIRRIDTSGTSRLVVVTVLLFLLLPFAGMDFGQREHFATLFVMPFILATAATAAGRPLPARLDFALGAVAGLGFGMKPHFLPAWVAIELGLMSVQRPPRRGIRQGAGGVMASLLVYALVVMLFIPQYFEMAREVVRVYGGLNEPVGTLLRLVDLRVWMVAVLCLLVIRIPPSHWRVSLLLLTAATGFLLAAMIQLKGWGYHLYPFRVIAGLFFVFTICALLDAHPAILGAIRGGRRSFVAATVASVIVLSPRYFAQAIWPTGVERVHMLNALVHREQASSLAVLSMRTIIYPAFPVVNYSRVKWVLRHNSLWFLPGFYRDQRGDMQFRSLAAMSPLERQYFEQVVADLCANPPEILIIEPAIPAAPPARGALDLVAYFRQDSRFDRLFAAYSPTDPVGPFRSYVSRSTASCSEAPNVTAPTAGRTPRRGVAIETFRQAQRQHGVSANRRRFRLFQT